MTINRRQFLYNSTLAALAIQIPGQVSQKRSYLNNSLKPSRLQKGDTVGLISPAGIIDPQDIDNAKQTLGNLGLKIKIAAHILDRYGYLAGKDLDRAQDINTMFADKSVKAIIATRGGWGCNRILPFLNYSLIRTHPKIIMGYSDVTSLLLAINARSQLITFHGPVAIYSWDQFTTDYFQRILFNGEVLKMQNNINGEEKRQIITPGKATGKLIGGNLSVLTSMLGSIYLPPWQKSMLFVEDTGEDVYRIDRMLTQLKNAGILDQISGFIFGQCTNCQVGDQPAFTLMEVLQSHIQPLKIPSWYGAAIGHIQDKFTLPVGLNVEIDADTGVIQLLEAAVS